MNHSPRNPLIGLLVLIPPALILLVGVLTLTVQGFAQEQERPATLLERLSGVFRGKPAVAEIDEPFEPTGELVCIDLSEHVNKKLTDGTDRVEGNTLESVKVGEQELAGVRFKIIDGMVQISSKTRPHWPEKVEGIPVNSELCCLYIFHATQGGAEDIKDGAHIGQYVCHYEDGSSKEIPIVYGEDLRNWWNDDRSEAAKRGKVAWTGKNKATEEYNLTLRLYVSKWENPNPDKKVKTIDFVSKNVGPAAPFCLAMTIEKAPAK